MFSCIPQISLPDFSQYLPKGGVSAKVQQLAGIIARFRPTFSPLEFSPLESLDKVKADIRPLCRSISLVTKGMEMVEILSPGIGFNRAIFVLNNASAIFDLGHIGCAMGYIKTVYDRVKTGEWKNEPPNHFVEVAFGLVSTGEILSFADKNNILKLASLAVIYGNIPLVSASLGTVITLGLIGGFSALTYVGAKELWRLTSPQVQEEEAEEAEEAADEEITKVAYNTAWAASELALIVLPMLLPIPKFAQLGAGMIVKGIGIKAHLLSI